jgi:hypothetical protein
MFEHLSLLAGRVAVVATLLLAAGLSIAADTGTTTSNAKSPVLTPGQLRDCLSQKDKLHAQKDDVLKTKAAIDADKAAIDAADAALDKDVQTLDKTSQQAVDDYNTRVRAREQMFGSYKDKVDVYNGKVDALSTSQDSYSKACENRRYDQRDLTDPKTKK